MSTTFQRPAQTHLWWYAAIAVLAGLVLALAISVLHAGSPSRSTGPAIPASQPVAAHHTGPTHACFAARPNESRDLAGVCNLPLP